MDTKIKAKQVLYFKFGGEAGIRTLGGVAPTTVFETAPFNRSGTSPLKRVTTISCKSCPQFYKTFGYDWPFYLV
jgi:hypothetical protein